MTYYAVIIWVMMAFAIASLCLSHHERANRQLYCVAFAAFAILICAKYYYGPDIISYVPYYENIESVSQILSGDYDGYFEVGFALFCSIAHTCGLSFWLMTVLIALIYLTIIYKLFERIEPNYRTFALFVLSYLDYKLPLFELRQCLAVAFFIGIYLAYTNKRYALSLLSAIAACLMHRSAIFAVALLFFFALFWQLKIDKKLYILTAICFIGILLIPLQSLIGSLLPALPLSEEMAVSLEHHLLLGKRFQVVFLIYFGAVFCLAYYGKFDPKNAKTHWLIWCCVCVVIVLYQNYYLLDRMRSYIVPIVMVYVCNAIAKSDVKDALPRQIYAALILLIAARFLINDTLSQGNLQSKTYQPSTVLRLTKQSEAQILKQQMYEAELLWEEDLPKIFEQLQ